MKKSTCDDPAQVVACKEKVNLCTKEITRIKRNRIIIIATVAAGGTVLIVLAILVLKRKRKVSVSEAPSELNFN